MLCIRLVITYIEKPFSPRFTYLLMRTTKTRDSRDKINVATNSGASTGSSQINPAVKNQPLFGIVDFTARKVQGITTEIEKLNRRVSAMEEGIKGVVELQKELKELIEQHRASTFSIERTQHQVMMPFYNNNIFLQ